MQTNRLTLAAAILAMAIGAGAQVSADPGVFPVNSKPCGKTYGQWVVSYWQWAWSIPLATNPWANDSAGEFAAIGQSGPVWFLGGSLGDSVTRQLSIPAGKAVFLPVHPWIFGAVAGDCEPSNPGVVCDEPTLQAAAAQAAEAVASMDVTIDGLVISDAAAYRVATSSFSVTVPDDNLLQVPAGTWSPQVADGYYLILAPLSAGSHTIWLHVVSTLGFEYTLTYLITVPAPPANAAVSAD